MRIALMLAASIALMMVAPTSQAAVWIGANIPGTDGTYCTPPVHRQVGPYDPDPVRAPTYTVDTSSTHQVGPYGVTYGGEDVVQVGPYDVPIPAAQAGPEIEVFDAGPVGPLDVGPVEEICVYY